MKTNSNYKSLGKTVGLEELESRIVFDGAIDEAPVITASVAVAESDTGTDAVDRAYQDGEDTLADGTYHYWAEDWNAGNGYSFDYYLYPNGVSGWAYQGANYDANGNGWQYAGDSSGFWEYTGVDWDSAGNGWEYWGSSSGDWIYQGAEWTGGLGWEYVGNSDGEWYYHCSGDDGAGLYEFLGNYTGYWDYDYTWYSGSNFTDDSGGDGDSDWYLDPDVTAPVAGEWFVSSQFDGYYQHDFPQTYYDATTATTVPVYTAYTADFETYYYYFPAVYYSNFGDDGFALHPVNGIGGEPGVNETWDYDCPIYDTSGTFDEWYLAGSGDYMAGWWTYNDSDAQYSVFTQDFETYDYYFVGFWYSSENGYEFNMESQDEDWTLPAVGSTDSPFVPTADHTRVDVVDSGSEWNDQAFHYADPAYNADDDYWAFTIIGDTSGEILMRYYVENPSAGFDPWAIVNGTDTSTLDVYVGMYYDEGGTYWGMEQDYLQEDVRAIWYDLPDFNVESWSYYTQLLAHAENTTIDQMVYSGHGNVNNFYVGEQVIASWSINNYATDLQGIGSVMSNGAQLQLWECLIAGDLDSNGQNAIDARHMLARLAYYTDSTVFASAESTWMIKEDNHVNDSSNAIWNESDWTMEFGVNPSGYQVAYTTLVYYVYDNSTWDPDWRDVDPYGESTVQYWGA